MLQIVSTTTVLEFFPLVSSIIISALTKNPNGILYPLHCGESSIGQKSGSFNSLSFSYGLSGVVGSGTSVCGLAFESETGF